MTVTISLTPFNAALTFRLQRKTEAFGTLSLDHWWMPVPSLYPTAKSVPDNFQAVVAGYWQLCQQAQSHTETDVAESYLLARLLPLTRSIGSRRIVADARLGNSRKSRIESGEALESLLAAGTLMPMTEDEFRARTGEVIGPTKMSTEAKARYREFSRQLFSTPLELLADDEGAALDDLRQRWLGWTQGFARRKGKEEDKQILDILSYEMRAALHRCYSAVWAYLLLPHLLQEHRLSPGSDLFLRFWHLEQSRETTPGSPSFFHLFRGHTFGLHPAGAMFIQTATGKSLVGDWIQNGGIWKSGSYGRLLRGLALAVHHYKERLDSSRKDRPVPKLLRNRNPHPRGRRVNRKCSQPD